MLSDAGSIPAASMMKLYGKLVGLRKNHIFSSLFFSLFLLVIFTFPQNLPLLRLSAKDYAGYSRVIISSSLPLAFTVEKSSSFLLVHLETKARLRIQRDTLESKFIKSFGWIKKDDAFTITIETRHSNFRFDSSIIREPYQLVIDFWDLEEKTPLSRPALEEERIAEPKKKEELSSPRGVRTIVIDPGHGGLETGAKGKFGAEEKDITLAISLGLKSVIERNLAFRVVLTRDTNMDVSLENRASIANNNKADLFISIHTNSSYRKNAQGSETFFLSLNATDEEARRLAYLENSSAEFESLIEKGNEDEIKMILWDMAQSAYIKQSSQLAELIQKELNLLLGTTNRGIKQAPFKVLTGVACPAVLAEVAFLSNPEEEKKLLDKTFQNNVAEAIYRGLLSYIKLYFQK